MRRLSKILFHSHKRLQSDIVYDSKQIAFVLNTVKLHELVAKFTDIKQRSNGDWTAKCLVCNNDGNCFRIHRTRNKFKCFHSGESGNCIAYISQKDSVPFDQAIKTIVNIMKLDIKLEPLRKKKQRHFFNHNRLRIFRRAIVAANNSEDDNLPF